MSAEISSRNSIVSSAISRKQESFSLTITVKKRRLRWKKSSHGCLEKANIDSMVITMGGEGAVYAERGGRSGFCPARKVQVRDTTGAGDAFCAGVVQRPDLRL